FSEQIGFGPAYLASASAVVAQAAVYTWALQRRLLPAAAFGILLAGLYARLYALLRLQEGPPPSRFPLPFSLPSVALCVSPDPAPPQPGLRYFDQASQLTFMLLGARLSRAAHGMVQPPHTSGSGEPRSQQYDHELDCADKHS